MSAVLLRGGRVGLGGPRGDVLLRDGRVARTAAVGTIDPASAEVLHLPDATVLPGVVDAHVHVDQWVHRARRVDVTAARDAEGAALLLAHADRAGVVLTGHGFHDERWPAPPHRSVLDVRWPTDPVAVVSHDLHVLWLNGAALDLAGHPGHPTGLLREGEAMAALRALLDAEPEHVVDRWVGEALAGVAAGGVVGLVDFEFADNVRVWRRRAAGGQPVQVAAAVWQPWLEAADEAGLRTGDRLVADGGAVVGPYKLMADGSLNSRTAHCHHPYAGSAEELTHGLRLMDVDAIAAALERATAAGLVPAVHAIGDAATSEVVEAFERTGTTGRIEHAQLVRLADLPRLAVAGIVASVQPQHAVADRDVADRLWRDRTDRAFAYGSMHAAGVALRLGSDAPVSPVDPWAAIADAVRRTDDDRPAWHREQALPLDVAVAAACGGRTTLAPGDAADLVVVDGDITADPSAVRDTVVLATVRAGHFTFRDS